MPGTATAKPPLRSGLAARAGGVMSKKKFGAING